MATNNTTSTLPNQVSVYYDKVFLEQFKAMLRFGMGAYKKSIPANSGKQIIFNRMAVPTLATTALTEGVNPTSIALSSTQVTSTINIYGASTQTSEFFEETSIDAGLKEQVEVMAQHGAETVNQVIRGVVTSFLTTPGSTIQRATGVATDALITSGLVLTGMEIRRAVRTLKKNKAMSFEDGYFMSIIPVETAYDLRGNTEWLDAYRYVDPSVIQNGEIGRLHGVRFFETNDATVTAGGTALSGLTNYAVSGTVADATRSIVGTTVTDIYETFVFGKQAFAIVDVQGADAGKEPIIIIKKPNVYDSSNALNMFSVISWKVKFSAVVLNSSWIVSIRTSAGV